MINYEQDFHTISRIRPLYPLLWWSSSAYGHEIGQFSFRTWHLPLPFTEAGKNNHYWKNMMWARKVKYGAVAAPVWYILNYNQLAIIIICCGLSSVQQAGCN